MKMPSFHIGLEKSRCALASSIQNSKLLLRKVCSTTELLPSLELVVSFLCGLLELECVSLHSGYPEARHQGLRPPRYLRDSCMARKPDCRYLLYNRREE